MVANSNGLLWKTNHLLALSAKMCSWMVQSFNNVWIFTINENYCNLLLPDSHLFDFTGCCDILKERLRLLPHGGGKWPESFQEFLKFWCWQVMAAEQTKSGSGQSASPACWKFWANEMSVQIKGAGQTRPKVCVPCELIWHESITPKCTQLW